MLYSFIFVFAIIQHVKRLIFIIYKFYIIKKGDSNGSVYKNNSVSNCEAELFSILLFLNQFVKFYIYQEVPDTLMAQTHLDHFLIFSDKTSSSRKKKQLL